MAVCGFGLGLLGLLRCGLCVIFLGFTSLGFCFCLHAVVYFDFLIGGFAFVGCYSVVPGFCGICVTYVVGGLVWFGSWCSGFSLRVWFCFPLG